MDGYWGVCNIYVKYRVSIYNYMNLMYYKHKRSSNKENGGIYVKAAKKGIALFLVLTLFVAGLPNLCFANTLGIKKVKQAKTNWCWAACAEMASNWENNSTGKTQWDIVQYVKGSFFTPYPNESGTVSETEKGAEYGTNFLANYNSQTMACSLSFIKNILNKYGNPVCAGCGYYENGKRKGGHMLVIHGCDNASKILVCDPATGKSQWVSYNYFLDGYGGRRYDHTVYTYFGSID